MAGPWQLLCNHSITGFSLRRAREVKGIAKIACGFLLAVLAPAAMAQVQVGDDLRMRMGGLLTAGYNADFGTQIPSDHSLNFGVNAQISGDYYNPNFLNFTLTPYYNRSAADSSYQSLTNSSGVDATVNLFSGSRFPGYASYHYTKDNTGTIGLTGTPNFTTIGTGHTFSVGWSALIPDLPTFSASYSQSDGGGTLFGTNEVSNSSTKVLNLRSSYHVAGWNLNANYSHLIVDSKIPLFLTGETGTDTSNSSGNNYGVNGSHTLPWNGMVALTFTRATYSGDFNSTLQPVANLTSFTTNTEMASLQVHPTSKLGLFASQSYTDDLNGYFYQNLINSGGGVPLQPQNSQSNSSTLAGGASYLILPNLYTQGQITYFNQTYLGQSYEGNYLSGTVGYNKRILHLFTVSATVLDSTNKFVDNALGFIFNVNGFHNFGPWETSGNYNYAQNVQTLLVTYTTSFSSYNGNVHRRLGRGKQWTGSFNGAHSGFSNQAGTSSHSEAYATSLALRRIALSANYTKSAGQSLLTSTGIQPIQPTPGLLPIGLIVYNGKSYSGTVTLTPKPRLSVSGSYSHAVSDTLSGNILSNNRTEIFYGQLQYRLRRISVLGGFTKFSQGISAAGTPPGSTYTYFIGVARWIDFF
jgi:hypothetical protein